MHNFQNVQKKGWVKAGFYINGQIAAVDLNFAVIVIFFVQGYIGPFSCSPCLSSRFTLVAQLQYWVYLMPFSWHHSLAVMPLALHSATKAAFSSFVIFLPPFQGFGGIVAHLYQGGKVPDY